MEIKILKPRKALNKAFLKVKPNRSEIECFKTNLIQLLDRTNDIESEEFHKNLVSDFLKKTYYDPDHFINTKGRNDLVIHNGKKAKSSVGVIIEAKKPTNKGEMVTKNNINVKAFQELVLYYLRERITHKNLEIKYLAATNINEWFIFDSNVFEKAFAQNKGLVKQFNDFESGRLAGKTTDFFYKEIAEPFIKDLKQDVEFTFFDIREYEKPLRNDNPKDDNKLISLFKLFSPEHLLKLPFANDSNSLDKRFYGELLHIIGLSETKEGSKKIIERNKKGERNTGSLLENAIIQLDSLDKINRLDNPSHFGKTQEERLFNVGLELSITWINRILFLKLLEAQLQTYHKGDKSYEFLSFRKIHNYDDLNSLFFQVLAKKQSERNEDVKELFAKVPYLNSSLFEPTGIEHGTLFISNLNDDKIIPIYSSTVLKSNNGKKRTGDLGAIEYLLEFLDAYDFSSEGSEKIQEDNKTLINASVLGLIFEKINGYKDGSFFTPGFITMYMCRETIRKAVVQKFNETKNWECTDIASLYNKIEDKIEANVILNSLKICDPAVGSGHFLVSALNEIIAIKNDLKILQDRDGKRLKEYQLEVVNDELIVTDEDGELFEYNPTNKESQRIQEALFHEKQAIIENCLFGVDINPNSVKICRLRLWIELLKNAYYKNKTELETLPNIDINIKCGNSLISRFSLNSDLKKALRKSKITISEYKDAVKTYMNAESKEQKNEMKSLIRKIKKDFKSTFHINIKENKDLANYRGQLINLQTANIDLFGVKLDKSRVSIESKRLKKLISQQEKKVTEIISNKIYEDAFEWRFEFPEVLDENGDFVGFDVIIGNPPYFPISQLNENIFLKNTYKTFNKSIDISALFYERGLQVLKHSGLLNFITTSRFCNTNYGYSLRKFISKKEIAHIVNFNDIQIFEDANVNTLILEIKNILPEKGVLSFKSITDIRNLDSSCREVNIRHFGTNHWMFYDDEILELKEKLDCNSERLIDLKGIFINRGVTTGANKIFVINEELKNELLDKDPNSLDLIKPILKGADIKRYYNIEASNWIIFTRKGTNIDQYPAIKEYLLKFKNELTPGIGRKKGNYNWFEIQDNTAFYKEFEKRKIIWTRLSNVNTFSISNHNEFTLDSSSFATYPESEYLCGILNSSVVLFYFKLGAVIWGKDGIKWFGEFFDNIPIPAANSEEKNKIKSIVNKILAIKALNSEEDTRDLELEIDHIAYKLYGLNENEVKIIQEANT